MRSQPPGDHPQAAPTQGTRTTEPVSASNPAPATSDQLQQAERNIEERMTKFEKSSIRLAWVAIGISTLAACFMCLQWWEMHTGGKDTHDLAVAAENQAGWMETFASKMQTQADRTKELADRMKDQADETKSIAEQTGQVANIANETLSADRAWIGFNTFQIDRFEPKQTIKATILLLNTGRSPAMSVRAGLGELYFKAASTKDWQDAAISEAIQGVELRPQPSIPPQGGLPIHLESRNPLPIETYDNIRNGTFKYLLDGRSEYRDVYGKQQWIRFCVSIQFVHPDDPVTWAFCDAGNDMSNPKTDRQAKPN